MAPAAGCSSSSAPSGVDAGTGATGANLVVSDQFNNRVIEITRAGQIVWSFGDGSSTPGPTSVVAPNDVERLPRRYHAHRGDWHVDRTCLSRQLP